MNRVGSRTVLSLVATLMGSVLMAPSAVTGQIRLDGEYGLRVTDSGGTLGVGWLTSGSRRGVLEVISDGSRVYRTESPRAEAHFATLPRPRGDTVILRYGELGAEDLHETLLYLNEEGSRPPTVLTDVDSLYVVGDVHGEFDRVVGLLRNAGLIDGENKWIGGDRHIVFLGDLFDRGADVTRILWFLYELEHEARAAGGGAHVVLGNHEAMIFTEDVRYVSRKEQLIAQLHGTTYTRLFDIRSSVLGRWLAGRPAVMKVNGALLAHGGVSPASSPRTVEAVNDSVRAFMAEDLFYRWADETMALVTDSAAAERVAAHYERVIVMDSDAIARRRAIFFDETSIMWFRGYVESDTLAAALDDVLEEFGADVHVVAHTPLRTIQARYGGKLLAVDLERAATEMLLLEWDVDQGRVYRRWKITPDAPPEPF